MITYTLSALYVKCTFDVYVKLHTLYVDSLRRICVLYVVSLYVETGFRLRRNFLRLRRLGHVYVVALYVVKNPY